MNTACEHEEFEFLDCSILRCNGLDLVLCDVVDAEFEDGRAPMYCFEIRLEGQSGHIGDLSLCVGEGGQVGLEGQLSYEIDEEFQGNHYSSKACRVAAELARAHGMREVWIVVSPENIAACRTAERLGAKLVEQVEVPEDSELYRQGQRHKNRYCWRIDRLQKMEVGLRGQKNCV